MGTNALERKLGVSFNIGWLFPCVGFGSFIFTADTINAPVLLSSNNLATFINMGLSVILLALLIWWASRKDWDNRWSLSAVIVSAACIALYYLLSLFFPEMLQYPALMVIAETACALGRAVLSFFWMVAILPLGSRRVCCLFTLSLCVFIVFCLLIVLFKENASRVLLVILPVLSAFCLQAFYRKRSTYFDISDPRKDEIAIQSREYLSDRANRFVYALGILVPLLCGATVLAIVHQSWPAAMESSQLLSAQMGILIGAVVMAVLQLVLVLFFRASANVMFASIIVPLFLVDMLFVSVSAPGWITAYYALFLLVEKSLIAFAVYSSYMFKIGKNWMGPWCFAFLAFYLGNFLGMAISRLVPTEQPALLLIVIVTLYVASVCVASLYFGTKTTKSYESHLAGGFDGENRFRAAINKIAESYGLTTREREILFELGKGRNAAYIAERLVISPQTAKMHQKNIYGKMDVHSQQDLIRLIDQAIEDDNGD